MRAIIEKQTEDILIVNWNDGWEFGTLKIEYFDSGLYIIDSENISLSRIMEILMNVKNVCPKCASNNIITTIYCNDCN